MSAKVGVVAVPLRWVSTPTKDVVSMTPPGLRKNASCKRQDCLHGRESWLPKVLGGSGAAAFLRWNRRRRGVRCRLTCFASVSSGSEAEEADVVVIGAGIGGLACAGLLARSGRRVVVLESHSVAGGVAHAFKRNGYEFDSGPSLLSGLSAINSPNPLRHVLNALGEDCEWVKYDGWRMVTPDGNFDFKVGDAASWDTILRRFGGSKAIKEWERLLAVVKPLGEASKGVPASALRGDLGAVVTLSRFLPQLLQLLPNGPRFQAPFSDILRQADVQDRFLQRWLDYICFVLQALPADRHPTAPVAYMLSDMFAPGASLDYPKDGMGGLISALVRGVERHGGEIHYGAHVEGVELDATGRVRGVRLRGSRRLLAREAVVSNASVWDTAKLLPRESGARESLAPAPPITGSFMHLHMGFRADAIPADTPLHFSVVRSWDEPVDAPSNIVIMSVPSVVNPSLAPPGKHCLHAYLAATEPYELWEGLTRGSPEYKTLKKERAAPLYAAVERALPGVCSSAELELVGSPLTHAHFARRHRGTYGPLAPADAGMLPGPRTGVEGLLCCGDSTFPGIGVPAAAASGSAAAAALLSVEEHMDALKAMGLV